jgi:hypothetical protein
VLVRLLNTLHNNKQPTIQGSTPQTGLQTALNNSIGHHSHQST